MEILYSFTPAALLVINLILNGSSLKHFGLWETKQDEKVLVNVRYNHFALTACCYLIVDMTWGVLYEFHENRALFPYIYWLTIFYYLFMFLAMLTWTRYIVAYLNRSGRRSTVLIHGAWIGFAVGVVCLILNRFNHVLFYYNDANEYVGEVGRNIAFLFQIAFYAVISNYLLYVAHKSVGRQQVRFKASAATSIVLGLFQIFQIFFPLFPCFAVGLLIGIVMVHSFVQHGARKEKEIHDHIALAMAESYEAIYYIEIASGEYLTFAKSRKHESLDLTENGKDFFTDGLANIDKCVYPEDREYAKAFFDKEKILESLKGRRSFSFKFRVIVGGEPKFFLFTVTPESSGYYLVFYVKDIDDELNAEKVQKENQQKTVTFEQIAENLASNYDEIYYVDIADSSYVGYEVSNIYGQLKISKSGADFFDDVANNLPQVVTKQDHNRVREFLSKDNLISALDMHKDYSLDYRLAIGEKNRYARMIVRKTSDGSHFIICVEDIDDEIRKAREQHRALKTEKELARRDELTGVKNKTAYMELEESVQGNIDNGMDYLTFALVVCDTNNLKQINDTQGHAAGDEYIRASARLLCDIYVHSPVFRVGGDEFVVFLRGNDYTSRFELLEKLRARVLENKRMGAGVILASGMSDFKPESDNYVTDIFDRADKEMYEDKQRLKS